MKTAPRRFAHTRHLGVALLLIATMLSMAACSTSRQRSDSSGTVATSSATTPAKSEPPQTRTATNEKVCRKMKSKDGSFEGCVYGNPPTSSKFSKLTIGMSQYQAEKLLSHPQDIKYVTNWGKAWIPFYQGTDARRLVWFYEGQGSVSFDTGGAYSDGGVVVEINYDPKIEL